MSVEILYKTTAKAQGGRDGKVSTEDGTFSAALSTPKELGGAGGTGANPEQLFASGYAACFLSAMKMVAAGMDGATVSEGATVAATVGVGPRAAGGFGLDVEMAVTLPGLEPAAAEALVAQTHKTCPYSNATHGNIRVAFSIFQ